MHTQRDNGITGQQIAAPQARPSLSGQTLKGAALSGAQHACGRDVDALAELAVGRGHTAQEGVERRLADHARALGRLARHHCAALLTHLHIAIAPQAARLSPHPAFTS